MTTEDNGFEVIHGYEGAEVYIVGNSYVDENGVILPRALDEIEDPLTETNFSYLIVYTNPETGITMTWSVPPEDLEYVTEGNFFTQGEFKRIDYKDIGGAGWVHAGSWKELGAEVTPEAIKSFYDDIRTYLANTPFINDPRFLAMLDEIYAENGSFLNADGTGVAITGAKHMNTWRRILMDYDYSDEQILASFEEWSKKVGYDRKIESNVATVRERLAASGGSLSESTIRWIAEQVTSAKWDETYMAQQIRFATDEYAPGRETSMDSELAAMLDPDREMVSTNEDVVLDLMNKWLPWSAHGDFDIAEEAGKIRANPNYKAEMIEKFKDEKQVLFGMYDREVSWASIWNTYSQKANSIWGITPERDDVDVLKAIQTNDSVQADKIFRQIGLDRGYEKTMNDLASDIGSGFNYGVIKSSSYLEKS